MNIKIAKSSVILAVLAMAIAHQHWWQLGLRARIRLQIRGAGEIGTI